MTIARSEQIDPEITPYYHCMARCVRRGYLCGIDQISGKDYSHRKSWILNKIKVLADIFSIKICAYAIMSNHYHLVLFLDKEAAIQWTHEEVQSRWASVYPNDAKKLDTLQNAGASQEQLQDVIEKWRERLMSISWFMKCLNEPIARMSNLEDDVTGRFWEGRFKSQSLLDDAAVLSAMAYVDLNPIRAKIASTPENSEFTSIYERIQYANRKKTNTITNPQPKQLMNFKIEGQNSNNIISSINFSFKDYLLLVDETGRLFKDPKKGRISNQLMPILKRLNLEESGWMKLVRNLTTSYSYAVGNSEHLDDFSNRFQKKYLKGRFLSQSCYLPAAA